MSTLYELIYPDGDQTRRVPLAEGDSVVVGRESCDVTLVGETRASRQHCRVWCEGGVVRVRDLASANGTTLDGAKLEDVAAWLPGQPLEVGLTTLQLVPPGMSPDELTPSPWSLIPEDGPAVALQTGETVVGRLGECRWQLDAKGVSGKHARLIADDSTLQVEDLGSSNGTFVDGRRIDAGTPTALGNGQKLRLAKVTFRVQCGDHAIPQTRIVRKDDEPQPPFRLVGRTDPVDGQTFDVRAGGRTVGRGSDCDWQIDDASVSTLHARLEASVSPPELAVVDLGSSNGTFVDGDRIDANAPRTLDHGTRLRFGAIKLRVERTDALPDGGPRPAPISSAKLPASGLPEPTSGSPIEPVTLAKAFALTSVVALLIVLAGRYVSSLPADTGGGLQISGNAGGDGDTGPELGSQEVAIRKLMKRHDYDEARALIRSAQGNVNQRLVALCERHQRLFGNLKERLRRVSDAEARTDVFGYAQVQVVRVDPRAVELFVQSKGLLELPWAELSSSELAQAYREQELDRKYPLDYASFIAFVGERDQALAFLRRAIAEEDVTLAQVEVILDELSWRVEPEELQPRVTRKDPEETGGQETGGSGGATGGDGPGVKVEPPKKDLEELMRRRQLEAVIRREAGEIMSLARLLRYDDAIGSLERLIEDSPTPALTARLKGDLQVLHREAGLFRKLIEVVNAGGIDLARIPSLRSSAGEGARIAAADDEFYTIALRAGEIRERWRYLGVERMLDVYRTLPRTAELLFARGVFAYERGKLSAANSALIAAKRKDPALSRKVDEYLAHRLEIPIPKEGFVAYEGRLVTPEEQEMRNKGLVRYGGEWVTPEDKAKLESGMVRYNGKWVAAKDAELLKQGFVKYEGKWHKKEELNKIRANWDKAWELETPRVQLRSNMNIDFVEELLARLDGAYRRYAKYWGKTPDSPLRFYAFRTFEDYQRYCQENNYNNLLGAAGFALPHKNICVGYNKGNTLSSFYSTMVHEGSHLFYGRVHRTMTPSWYAEAMSTFHEAHAWKDGSKKELLTGTWNRMRYYGLRWVIRDGHYTPYAKLMVGNALQSINTSRAASSSFYCQNWALYYYFEVGCKDEAIRKKWFAFRAKMDGGALNGRGRGPGGAGAASKAMFETDVMSCEELDRRIKAFYTDPANIPKGSEANRNNPRRGPPKKESE